MSGSLSHGQSYGLIRLPHSSPGKITYAWGFCWFIVGSLSDVCGGFGLLSFVVSCQVCLAALSSGTGRARIAGNVQKDGQRVHTDRSSQRRFFSSKTITPL